MRAMCPSRHAAGRAAVPDRSALMSSVGRVLNERPTSQWTVVHGEVPEAELTCYAIDVRDDPDHEL